MWTGQTVKIICRYPAITGREFINYQGSYSEALEYIEGSFPDPEDEVVNYEDIRWEALKEAGHDQ